MSVRIHQLIVSGPAKPDATVEFGGLSHLVFGPTDTGKSYIVECLRYGLGGDDRPRDVGWSEGYTTVAIQIDADGASYTLFRDLRQGGEAVYKGTHSRPPNTSHQGETEAGSIGALLLAASNGTNRKILTKSGILQNFTASDLRHLSLFDEIETLDKVPLEGRDNLLKMRRRSATALVLSGTDDSRAILATPTNQRNIAKGHVEALQEEIRTLNARVPESLTKASAEHALRETGAEVERIGNYLLAHLHELAALKTQRAEIERLLRRAEQRLTSLVEAQNRFDLLDQKYESDLQRLQALASAAAIVPVFETRPCPLCKTDLVHMNQHPDEDGQFASLRSAARAESEKIRLLREGLRKALADIAEDTDEVRTEIRSLQNEQERNNASQATLVQPARPAEEKTLSELTERRSNLTLAVRDFERIEQLNLRLTTMKARTKRQVQSVHRDLSASATVLCERILKLLALWGVPGVDSVAFDEAHGDIQINQRARVSFGKGKRGIFLTAYIVSLMEHALSKGHPHLGLVAIDSPVVTYKDPKHGSSDSEEALDVTVKDRFYNWLADREEHGQVVVFENEEPEGDSRSGMRFTEFVGVGEADGRKGFFPS